jgi:hypothetical protein
VAVLNLDLASVTQHTRESGAGHGRGETLAQKRLNLELASVTQHTRGSGAGHGRGASSLECEEDGLLDFQRG